MHDDEATLSNLLARYVHPNVADVPIHADRVVEKNDLRCTVHASRWTARKVAKSTGRPSVRALDLLVLAKMFFSYVCSAAWFAKSSV